MNIIIAAQETKQMVLDAASWPLSKKPNDSLGRSHIANLLTKIVDGTVKGEKAHRWLGWSQAALVGTGNATLDEMKDINRRA